MTQDKPHDPYLLSEHALQRMANLAENESGLHSLFNGLAAIALAMTCTYGVLNDKMEQAAGAGSLAAAHVALARYHRRREPIYRQQLEQVSVTIASAPLIPMFGVPQPAAPQNTLTAEDRQALGQLEARSLRERGATYGLTTLSFGLLTTAALLTGNPTTTVALGTLTLASGVTAFRRLSRANQPTEQLGADFGNEFYVRYKDNLLVPRYAPGTKIPASAPSHD